MEQQKVRTYLLYAIGEIALVMIGILLALQVNNWNEERKQADEERTLLINVMDAIRTDSLNLEYSIDALNRVNEIHQMLYRIHRNEISADSLTDTYLLRRSMLFEPVTNRDYPDLANQVMDPGARQAVLNYYQSLRNWQFITDTYNEFIEKQMRPGLAEYQLLNFGYKFEDAESNDMIDDKLLVRLLDDPNFRQLLFEATVKTGNLPGVENFISSQRENLKAEIRRVLE